MMWWQFRANVCHGYKIFVKLAANEVFFFARLLPRQILWYNIFRTAQVGLTCFSMMIPVSPINFSGLYYQVNDIFSFLRSDIWWTYYFYTETLQYYMQMNIRFQLRRPSESGVFKNLMSTAPPWYANVNSTLTTYNFSKPTPQQFVLVLVDQQHRTLDAFPIFVLTDLMSKCYWYTVPPEK